MNIILTQQDADFILKYIRNDLEQLAEVSSELDEKYKKLQSSFTDRLKSNRDAVTIMEIARTAAEAMSETTTEMKNDLEKCIMLLTVGSEVKDENIA